MNLEVICFLVFAAILTMMLTIERAASRDRATVASRVRKLKVEDVRKKTEGESAYASGNDMWRRMLAWAGGLSISRRIGRLLDKRLEEADILLRGGEFTVIVILSILGPFVFTAALTLNVSTALLFAVIGGIIPFAVLNSARVKRLANFNAQICDALSIMSNSLRSGFSFLQSMDMVRRELPDPIKKEFWRTIREMNLGTSADEAMNNLAKRVNSEDLDLIVTAVLIQRQVGGNLSEILDNIAEAIRDRVRIKREIKTLTAQGRISGLIISLLPILLGIFIFTTNQSYIMELFNSRIGLLMLVLAAVGEVLGMLVIRKIVDIKF
jgi:tight adherence protein B